MPFNMFLRKKKNGVKALLNCFDPRQQISTVKTGHIDEKQPRSEATGLWHGATAVQIPHALLQLFERNSTLKRNSPLFSNSSHLE